MTNTLVNHSTKFDQELMGKYSVGEGLMGRIFCTGGAYEEIFGREGAANDPLSVFVNARLKSGRL